MKSKFHTLSLQGISGIVFGLISILYIALVQLFLNDFLEDSTVVSFLPITYFEIFIEVFTVFYLGISYLTIVLINKKRRKKLGLKTWDASSKRVLAIFISFLVTFGILTYSFISEGTLKNIIPTSLILCGIACIMAFKHTQGFSKYLGFLFILNGIVALLLPQFMFYLWGIAFGFYPIIYGIFSFKKTRFLSTS